MLEKTFSPQSVEENTYQKWEQKGVMASGYIKNGAPFTMMMPPPNVTGRLHLGHALTYTLPDILARYHRMQGRDVLWQPGTDHAGISTQIMVEKKLESEGTSRQALGRDEFLKQTWQWKEQYGDVITSQQRKLGISPDWSRQRFTLDEGLSLSVRQVFLDLYKKGLVYRDKRLVNWDPKLETAVSDLEVDTREVEGVMYYINYPLVQDSTQYIAIATTRPETLFGDMAIAVHPDNPTYKHLIGQKAQLPLTGREIPIIADEYADPEKGTGAVKITPAHDFNDFEVGKRHKLEFMNIFDHKAYLNENVSAAYQKLNRFEARKSVIKDLKEQGLFIKEESITQSVPFGEKSGEIIEPWLMDQWYVDAATLAKPAIKAVEDGRIQFVPAHWQNTYFEWLKNIQPWCISRQLWWGHRIPIWYGPDGRPFAAMNQEEAVQEAKSFYGQDDITLTQDDDVLDTWFSSALWPFSTLGWPEETPELKRNYSTDVLVTGFDIIFFWVARMIMMGLHFMKEVPFRTVYIHALIRDEKGQKMSKTKGNVIDPLEVIDAYGADALRFTLASLVSAGRDIKFSQNHVESSRNFSTKIWNAARFCEMNGCEIDPNFSPEGVSNPLNQWIIAEVNGLVAKVTTAIESYKFNEASSDIYQFVWGTFCDWYLEFTKSSLTKDNPEKEEIQATTAWVFDHILRLLHPFMPFLTEELWTHFYPNHNSFIVESAWPKSLNLTAQMQDAQKDMNWVIALISEIRKLRSEANVPPAAKITLNLYDISNVVEGRATLFAGIIKHLARLESIQLHKNSPKVADLKGGVQGLVDSATIVLPLSNAIDIEGEKARLHKELSKVQAEVSKIESKLNNQDFIVGAPQAVIDENKKRLMIEKETESKLQTALERLN